jgi:hypothetical protein
MGEAVENILYRQIYPALLCHIPDEQFGFLPRPDTTLQLLGFAEVQWAGIHNSHIPWRVQSRRHALERRTHLQARRSCNTWLQSSSSPQPCWSQVYNHNGRNIFRLNMQGTRARRPGPVSVQYIARWPGIEISQFADDTAAYTSSRTTCSSTCLI